MRVMPQCFVMPRRTVSSDRGLCSTADSPCCEQTAALVLLGSVCKRSLQVQVQVEQVVQHCTGIRCSRLCNTAQVVLGGVL